MSPHSLLGLMWLASPALPVGGFSYSEGLEAAIDAQLVHHEASAAAWLCDQLHLGLARAELPAVMAVHSAWLSNDMPRVAQINTWLLATRETHELRAQTLQMGRSMLAWLLQREQREQPDPRVAALATLEPTWPAGFALAALYNGADAQGTGLAYGFSWAENQVQAALKAVPLGQSAGQRILATLARELPAAVAAAAVLPQDRWQAFTPGLALHSARHETQYSRLFRS
jgi:urease accessory protein